MPSRKNDKKGRGKSVPTAKAGAGGTAAGASASASAPQDMELVEALAAGELAALASLDATVRHGRIRAGHGIEVRLSAQSLNDSVSVPRIDATIDLHGGIFAALPNGLGSMAQMLLPLPARIEGARIEGLDHNLSSWSATVVFGAKKLSRRRLESTLEDIVANGDPSFVFELRQRRTGHLLGFLPTRASLLQRGLADPATSVRDRAVSGKSFRKSSLRLCVGWMRWWLMPLAFLAASWYLFLQPELLLHHIPLVPMLTGTTGEGGAHTSVASALPPHPRSMSEAFQLGRIHGEIQQLQLHAERGAAGTDRIEALLHQAGSLLDDSGNVQVSAEQMDGMLAELLRFEAHVGVVARVLGFFTFVNTIWLFAIIGITASIGPSIYHLLQPLHEALRRLIRWLHNEVLLPTILRLHRWGVLEALIWVGCWLGLAQAMKATASLDIGEMISLTASGLVVPALGYTTMLRGRRTSSEIYATIFPLYIAATCLPWAVYWQSSLYGYVVVASVYGALGFGVAHHTLCICIGFNSKHALHRCFAASLALVSSFIVLKLSGAVDADAAGRIVAPFSSAISVFGSVVLFLSLLIISSQHYSRPEIYGDGYGQKPTIWRQWWYTNVAMVVLLLTLGLVGHTTGLTGMANTSTTFAVLYALEKYSEFHLDCEFNGWVLVLLLSMAAWRGSLWLHANPSHIVSMFSL